MSTPADSGGKPTRIWVRQHTEVAWSAEAAEHPEIVAVIVVSVDHADDETIRLTDKVDVVLGPAWRLGDDTEAFIRTVVVPHVARLVDLEPGSQPAPWRLAPPSHVQLALDALGPVEVDEPLALGPRATGYAGAIELYTSEHWTGATDDPAVKAGIDVETEDGRPVHACVLESPFSGVDQRERFVAEEVRPRLDRLAVHGPEPDGWYEVSTGHLQLTLVERTLPSLSDPP
jgi:hypothetical protein